jgi:hypothetical protein
VFFRIPHVGKATRSLQVNSDQTILDDIWAWRADHGSGVGWTVNTARTGVVVNGNHVTAICLFVEHYQRFDVRWNGEHGRTVFFQNEMPYDPPAQADWEHHGLLGFAAYKVANSVTTHHGWGLGSYIFTEVNPALHASDAFECGHPARCRRPSDTNRAGSQQSRELPLPASAWAAWAAWHQPKKTSTSS